MKITVFKKLSNTFGRAFATCDARTVPPEGFSPCAAIEGTRDDGAMDGAVKHIGLEFGVVLETSPHVLVCGVVRILTMRSVPFRMTFDG